MTDPKPDPDHDSDADLDFDIDFDGIVQARDAHHRTLCFRRHLDHPVAAVWPHLVRPELLPGWLAAVDTLEPAEGGAVVLRWLNTDDQGRSAVAAGRVSGYDPPTLVEYDTDTHGRIHFELQDEGGGTALALEVTLPAPIEHEATYLAGWHLHLDYLAEALDGEPVDWSQWERDRVERWQPLYEWYSSRYSG